MIVLALGGGGIAGASDAASSASSTSEVALVYEADWTDGISGWAGGTGWKTLNGVLLNDGTGGSGGFNTIYADFEPRPTADNAVEAEIRVLRDGFGGFGLVTRDGWYIAGVRWNEGTGIWYGGDESKIASAAGFDHGGEWHTYRVEAKGNVIRFLVDDAVLAEVTDNRYLEGGQVGLWSNSETQLEIRSFKVFAL
ncbi:MAG: hypothetical protein ACRD0K_20740 [Egibacteraceae bacterium]